MDPINRHCWSCFLQHLPFPNFQGNGILPHGILDCGLDFLLIIVDEDFHPHVRPQVMLTMAGFLLFIRGSC